MSSPVAEAAPASLDQLQAGFLALLPRIRNLARLRFSYIECPAKREDHVAEALAIAWRWFVRLHERGKDPARFPMTFTLLVTRAVASGRRLCGQERLRDVLGAPARRRYGFRVEPLPAWLRTAHEDRYGDPHGQMEQDTYEERLQDNHRTPVPDQANFRLSFPLFLGSLPHRDRDLAEFLAQGNTAQEAAQAFGLSPGRVTQLRQRMCKHWYAMHGEVAPFEAKARRAGTDAV